MNDTKKIRTGLGNNDWIEWVEFNPQSVSLCDIDEFILERKSFWDKLESECVKECCGFDAYSFLSKDIRKAKSGEKNFNTYIKKFVEHVSNSNNEILITEYMNQIIHKTTLLNLLTHIERTN